MAEQVVTVKARIGTGKKMRIKNVELDLSKIKSLFHLRQEEAAKSLVSLLCIDRLRDSNTSTVRIINKPQSSLPEARNQPMAVRESLHIFGVQRSTLVFETSRPFGGRTPAGRGAVTDAIYFGDGRLLHDGLLSVLFLL